MKIAIARTVYGGLSNAMLLAQHNGVMAFDIVKEKIDRLNYKQSPIEHTEILDSTQNKTLNFSPTLDKHQAYKNVCFMTIATPTDYDQVPNSLISAIVDVNKTRKNFIVDSILKRNPKVVDIYCLVMKSGSENFMASTIKSIIKHKKAKGIEVVIYESAFEDEDFFNLKTTTDLNESKLISGVVANRFLGEVENVKGEIYTCDLFGLS
jgi:UDP-glucose 6-dehydrogenase